MANLLVFGRRRKRMTDRMVEIGLWMTKYVSVPISVVMLVLLWLRNKRG